MRRSNKRNNSQIKDACKALSNIAMFIKDA